VKQQPESAPWSKPEKLYFVFVRVQSGLLGAVALYPLLIGILGEIAFPQDIWTIVQWYTGIGLAATVLATFSGIFLGYASYWVRTDDGTGSLRGVKRFAIVALGMQCIAIVLAGLVGFAAVTGDFILGTAALLAALMGVAVFTLAQLAIFPPKDEEVPE
jgi:hypothetical protein